MQSRPFKTPKQVLTAAAFSIGNALSSALMSNTKNLLVQIKVDHHQLVGDLRVEGQIHNEKMCIRDRLGGAIHSQNKNYFREPEIHSF